MAVPFKKILCPFDFEPNSLAALDIAAKLAERDGAILYLLHVAATPTVLPRQLEPWKDWERIAKARLDEIATESFGPEVCYETRLIIGDAALEIVKTANDLQADLVVMATHGRSGLPRLLLGSVAERVLRESSHPVMIIRPRLEEEAAQN